MDVQPSPSNPIPADPQKFIARLYERLSEIPHVTWDQDQPCFHTSYDDWYALGTLHLHELESSDRSQDSSRPSSVSRKRPSIPSTKSSESLFRQSQKEEGDVRVVARISQKLLRLQRQYNLGLTVYASTENYGDHRLRLRSQHRLNPRNADEPPLQAILADIPGPNRLRDLLNMGPSYFTGSEIPDLHKKDPNMTSSGRFPTGNVSLSEFLEFAIAASECIEMLHTSSQVVHGEIRGDSFHYHPDTRLVKLVNFGSGTRAFEHGLTSAGWSTLSQEYGVEHKLQFIAPEQTGRLPAAPDGRTDIYSLGIVFWNMLTGQLPFQGTTALEVMQNVLSRRVPQLASKRVDVPDALSSVIHDMVQKSIEDRYHSITGVKYDLQQIFRILTEGDGEALRDFKIRQRDVSCYFNLPNIQVGRDSERDRILAVIEKVSSLQKRKRPVLGRTLSPLGSSSSISDGGSKDDASDDASINSRSSSVQNGTLSGNYRKQDQLSSLPEGEDVGSLDNSTVPLERAPSRRSDDKRFSVEARLSPSSATNGSRTLSSFNMQEGQGSLFRNDSKYFRKGNCEVITISGMAGLGKSTLVQSVQSTARATGGGYFASSKFDQVKQTPFGPVLNAISSLFRQIFSESNVNTDFHNNLRSFIRPVWHMLSRMLSLPEWLIDTGKPHKPVEQGSQIPRRQLSQINSRRASSPKRNRRCGGIGSDAASFLKTGASSKSSRFMAIFLDVLRFLSLNRLIILALDDLQFADDESLELLQAVVVTKVNIAIILTYRERDMLPEKVQSFLGTESAHVTKIQLAALTENDVAEYVSETLHRPQEYIFSLVAVILEKSRGVPFFLKEMLQTCYTKGCIWFSWKDSSWQFDLDRVFKEFESCNYGDSSNSNGLILNKFYELPTSSRNLVAWAALLGNTFSFSLVKKLMMGYDITPHHSGEGTSGHSRGDLVRQTSSDALRGLQGAIAAYIIMPGEDDDQFRFVHDRYQTAARSLPEGHNCMEMHFAISQNLVKDFDTQTDDAVELYDLSGHICAAVSLVKEREKSRAMYREVLFRAAEKATESGARTAGLKYFSAALDLLQDKAWDETQPDVYYQETLALYARTAEAYWFLGQADSAMELLETTFREAKDAVDKAPAWILKSRIKSRLGDGKTAFKVLKLCLSELGIDLPSTTWEECDAKYFKLKEELEAHNPDDLLARPLATCRWLTTMGSVMCEIMAAAFWTDVLLFYQLALKDMWIHLHRGVVSQAGLAYIHFAAMSVGRHGKVEFGCHMGNLGKRFLELYDNDGYTIGRGWTLYTLLVGHLCHPLHHALPQLERAQNSSLHAGDRFAAIMNIGAVAGMRLWCSHNIADIEAYCSYAAEEIPGWEKDARGGVMILAVRQFCRALQGKTYTNTPTTIFTDSSHDQVEFLKVVCENSSSPFRSKCGYYCFAIPALFLYGHYQEAIRLGEEVACLPEQYWSHRMLISIQFYISLAYLNQIRESPDQIDKDYALEYVRSCHKRMIAWSKVNDVNFLVWTSVLHAELSEIEERYQDSLPAYEGASDHAELHGMVYEQALISQLYAEWLIRRGANRPARNSLRESISAWRRLSATGKAEQVAEKHEWLLRGTSSLNTVDYGCQTIETGDLKASKIDGGYGSDELNHQIVNSANGVDGTKTDEVLDMIDLKAILQSSEALSSTLDLDQLLGKMTRIILDTTGSELSAIIIEDDDIGWSVAGISDSNGTDYPAGESLESAEDVVGKQITLYCLRFKETVFIRNIFEDDRFSNVPESYRSRNPHGKAIIAIPILRGDQAVLGCVYTEGPPYSFTERSKTVLQLLVNSIAISITNAMLFKRVEKVSANNAVMIESQKHALQQARNSEKKAKLAEAEAIRNAKLKEEAAKAKSMFLANVSHELRTPLNGVIGMSELLKSSTLSAEQESYADSIRVCADTLLTVINDILDFSKLEAGKMQMFSVPLSLSETINEVVRALSYSNMGKDLETITDLHVGDDLFVMGDPVRLHQILMNLLSNAYKFTTHGSVTVRAVIEEQTEEDITVTCSVIDTGIGISEEVKQKLFLPFSQADSSTARAVGGTGLGLSICKAIIENVMKGKIWLESQIGQGTTVSFTLDFKKAPKDDGESATSPRANDHDPMAIYSPKQEEPPSTSLQQVQNLSVIPRDKIRVCIAEDNQINSKIAVSFVKKLGLNAEAFADGQQAVDALAKASSDGSPFHLVLMDVQMPVLDGYDATRAIRKHSDPAVREVLVIAMTASAIRGDREKCLEAGMNNYMAKPVRQQVLQEVLDNYLKSEPNGAAATTKPAKEPKVKPETNGDKPKT